MEENLFDLLERMESIIPDYSYESMKKIAETDKKIKAHLLSEMKVIKDNMFHVVQASYEIQRDKLSEGAEDVWDDITSLMNRIENSRTCNPKGGKDYCEKCMRRVERNLRDIISMDRRLVVTTGNMKGDVHTLYKMLFDEGREKSFIKNLDKIKTYVEELNTMVDEREKSIVG
ncbi:MAG: hypothetical protein JSV63_00970 [Candidatus Aenigmatarchaeota archaeon]|nr:MAG: hypothetical protein JSV63_00970 [Candidatus Aenigmarchaeota archaeon]